MLRRIWLVAATAAVVIVLDALAKQWALGALQMGQTQPFLPGVLQFTLTTNTGGAFGIGREIKGLMTLLPMVICAGIIYWIWKRESRSEHLSVIEQIGFGLLLGGALGNIADRLIRGTVTDFLEFAFVQFPVFNVADALIDVGIALLIISSLLPPGVPASKQQVDVNG
jgi:signal peptidase II